MNNWIAVSLNSRFARDILSIVGTNTIARMILLFTTPIVTRLYSPEYFGIAAVVTSLIGILGGVGALRYDRAIVLAEDKGKSNAIVFMATFVTLGVCLILAVVVFSFQKDIIHILKIESDLSGLLYYIPMGAFVGSMTNILSGWVLWNKQFNLLGVSVVVQSFLDVFVKLSGAFFIFPSAGLLILGKVIGSAGAFFILFFFGYKKQSIPPKILLHKKREDFIGLAKEYRDFPVYNMPSAFLRRFAQAVPIFLLTSFFEPGVAGLYSLAYTTLNMPVAILSNSVRKVVLKEQAEKITAGIPLQNFTLKVTIVLSLIGIVPFGILFTCGPKLFAFVFDAQWIKAGEMASLMAPWLFLMFIDPATMTLYIVKRMQKDMLNMQILFLCLKVLVFVGAFYIFHETMVVLAIFWGTSFCLHLVMMIYPFIKEKVRQ